MYESEKKICLAFSFLSFTFVFTLGGLIPSKKEFTINFPIIFMIQKLEWKSKYWKEDWRIEKKIVICLYM